MTANQPSDALKQAGGGASQTQGATTALSNTVISYLKAIFESHADADGRWTRGQITRFIQRVQKNSDKTTAAADLLDRSDVDLNAFLQYMTSPDGNITEPWNQSDLSWPLSSYFISSSHNTYLTGNQLYSDSTTDAYTNVLLRGCRCVEVDVWDGDESDLSSSPAESLADEETDDETVPAKSKHRGAFDKLRQKIPESLTSRLEKTSLGKAREHRYTGRHGTGAAARAFSHGGARTVPEVALVEPRVLHGYTLTKEVSFRDVCNAIRDSAFAVSDLPLIVSLEVHCGAEQQVVMANIMKEVWSGMLVTEDEAKPGLLPSPDHLKRKILVKVKYAPPDAPAAEPDSSEDDSPPAEAAPPKKPSKVIQELSKLGIYTQAVSFKAWTQPEASMPTHIFSLAEKKFIEHREKHPQALFDHNRDYLLRAYPSGFRITSSNMMPTVFWGSGAQVVALNWQQTDEGMMLNEGMFAGTCGYVLKPEGQTISNPPFPSRPVSANTDKGYRPNLESKLTPNKITYKTLNLSLTFLAAQSIPLPQGDKSDKKFHPYVKTELHVDACDPKAHGRPGSSESLDSDVRHKARTKTHRGANVDLGRQQISFSDIAGLVEELTFVRFTVRDDELGRDDIAAWACVRLDRLGQGYRFIHLIDSKGRLTDGTILVKVEKTLVEEEPDVKRA
ncbi:phosphatidyl inositol-specific phospholipase C [Metarhizium album ARSEF 1941]|uniref:Phosphoinositide phospholipase C n=1 Tax=Metarhizium album (strain ARSEF 1941) TaxID=1081103 RepID=A0A0B2X1U7_METAS|nr:phosphatidyl inositol-specific phospholipase C [Metarhizium album ARSEF 1941]KHN99677.1 phosphatidyl inositol-specific phospholipase C [Metarhizium album ARSEF 1941]